MKILTSWLRSYLPPLEVDDTRLADDLTLRGIAVEGITPVEGTRETIFEMDITTNRVDAMNHYGVAREIAAIYNLSLNPLDTSLPSSTTIARPYPVTIEAKDLCGRFTIQVIRGVTIAPTQGLVSNYFQALGQKQISNAVDATNFALLGIGQPTHAFDLDKVTGGLIVRRAHAGEQIKLLDGSTRILVPEDLVVADEVKALGIAGVMGGWDSMITAETKNILVEAAWFEPATVRASSRRHMIHTDASHRFERGADFNASPIGNAIVTKTILAACGGTLEGDLIDLIVPAFESAISNRPPIQLSVRNVQKLLGKTVSPEGITAPLINRYLTALGCVLKPENADSYEVTLPSWRLDLSREIDLIEEIARVYGYNGFANTLPTPSEVIPHPSHRAERAIRARLFELGFTETLSTTFASDADSTEFAPHLKPVPLENPLHDEARNLRPSLVPGMVAMLQTNLNRDVLTARLFEMGAIFSSSADAVTESQSLTLGLTSNDQHTGMHSPEDAPFYELKGAVEFLLTLFTAPPATWSANSLPTFFEPGRAASASINETVIATLGQFNAQHSASRKIRQPIHLAEINVAALLHLPLRQASAKDISRFQAVQRDFSFTFANQVSWQQIRTAILNLSIAELRTIDPIEIFRNEQKWPGVFSTLIRIVFQSDQHTLTDTELSTWWQSIITALTALGGTLRS